MSASWTDRRGTGRAAVDTAASLLCRALGPGGKTWLETQRPGYRPRCPTDLNDLERLVAGRRWEDAVALPNGELLASDPGSRVAGRRRRDFARRRLELLIAAARAAPTAAMMRWRSERFTMAMTLTRCGRTPTGDRWRA